MTESAHGSSVAALITKVEPAEDLDKGELTGWLVKLMMLGAKSTGFWSSEIMPPDGHRLQWYLVQRFRSAIDAQAWRDSEARRRLVDEFSTRTKHSVSDELSNNGSAEVGNVATAVVTEVKPGMSEDYFAWECKIQTAQAKFPGYGGTYLQPPTPSTAGRWTTLLRFQSPEALEKWFTSQQRAELVKEAEKFVVATQFKNVSNSFPGWFPLDEAGEPPPNWKSAMLVLLGLFPVVMLEIRFLSPLLAGMNSAVANFLSLVISVVLTTWGTMPAFIKAFGWWLFPPKDSPIDSVNMKGTLILAGLFAAEIAALWNLLAH